VQKITVRTLLRALAMSPAIALGWGWGRGRAKAAPAAPADPLTVDASGVTVKGKLDVNGDVGINGKVAVNGGFNGAVRVMDGGTQTYNGGIATEVNAHLINFGMNEDSVNRFGGSYTSAVQGGLFRVDTRSGQPLFSWAGRDAGSSATMSQLMSIGSNGDVTFNGKVAVNGGFNGAVRVMDGGKQTYNGGIATEVNAQLINFGMNEDRFGGSYTSAVQGGLFRVDTRSGEPLFSWTGRQAGAQTPSRLMSIGSNGDVTFNGPVQAKSLSFGEERLRIIRGIIIKRTEIYGKGFSLRPKTQDGLHRIEFNPAFTADPTVIGGSVRGNTWVSCHQMEKDYCLIKTGSGGSDLDQDFTFIAIGPA
jgi:cytoskeletal protein CcmA (bactofilin family)